jgi:hypothetical protein
MGRTLQNALSNLNLTDAYSRALRNLGIKMEELIDEVHKKYKIYNQRESIFKQHFTFLFLSLSLSLFLSINIFILIFSLDLCCEGK